MRRHPGIGKPDPRDGSAVADRVWRPDGDGAFPTAIRRTSMDEGTLGLRAPSGNSELRSTRVEGRVVIDRPCGEIDTIRPPVAAANLEHQANGAPHALRQCPPGRYIMT